jgi:pimeloyl-ACP methyl ester carboxylesterase
LYRGPDPFKWSGYFSFRVWAKPSQDWNRQQAADSLAWWAHRRLAPERDLIGHSYGGSLTMMATRSEKRVRGMVLLSPAVHRTCLPDPANYEQLLHVWTKLDLVLLADVSKPSLLRSLPNVTQRRVGRRGLTGHSATHDPVVWRRSGLADYVKDEWLPSLTRRRLDSELPATLRPFPDPRA